VKAIAYKTNYSDSTVTSVTYTFAKWREVGRFPTAEDINAVHVVDANTVFGVGNSGLVFKSTDAGANWITLHTGTFYSFLDVYFISSSVGWIAGERGRIYKTVDGGITWNFQVNLNINGVSDLYFSSANDGWLAGGVDGGYLAKTTNGGTSWTTVSTGTTQSLYSTSF
jgi:photosystem II stability/assembly factor-like uncharacterized protein